VSLRENVCVRAVYPPPRVCSWGEISLGPKTVLSLLGGPLIMEAGCWCSSGGCMSPPRKGGVLFMKERSPPPGRGPIFCAPLFLGRGGKIPPFGPPKRVFSRGNPLFLWGNLAPVVEKHFVPLKICPLFARARTRLNFLWGGSPGYFCPPKLEGISG